MSNLVLGRDPDDLTVLLMPGVEWWSILDRTNTDGQDWPGDATCTLQFADGTVWPATISGPKITFTRTAGQVDAVLAGGRQQKVDLRYSSGGHTLLWARGRVATHG